MGRNLVVCLDGTGNQLQARGSTNVVKTFRAADKHDETVQLAYYDPGVGTFSSSGSTAVGRWFSKVLGLAFGLGLTENLTQAYTWLMQHWQPGDRIYLFGFSRGAYAVRCLAGMLNSPGLLRPGLENLVPYAFQRYFAKRDAMETGIDDETTAEFSDAFCWLPMADDQYRTIEHRRLTRRHSVPVAYMGLWDTVSASGLLRFDKLPDTAGLPNALRVQHAMSIDERRAPYRIDRVSKRSGELRDTVRETWFAGVHSDVGGTFHDDHKLAELAFRWVLAGAVEQGLVLRDRSQGLLAPDPALGLGTLHRMGLLWHLLGSRRRRIDEDDSVHASVEYRQQHPHLAYRPRLPRQVVWDASCWIPAMPTPRQPAPTQTVERDRATV